MGELGENGEPDEAQRIVRDVRGVLAQFPSILSCPSHLRREVTQRSEGPHPVTKSPSP